MKRLITSMLIVLLISVAFIGSFYKGYYSYATNQDGTLTNDELDIAMSSWLQSHGGNIFSPQNYRARKTYEAGLLHNFVYGDGGGYDAIRQHIYGGVGGNNELRFDFDGFIIQKLNTWLNRELQNGSFGENASLNENGMFVDGVENTVYSGQYYTDPFTSQTCLVYVTDGLDSSTNIRAHGTTYMYTWDDLLALLGTNSDYQTSGFHKTPTNKTLTLTVHKQTSTNSIYTQVNNSGGYHSATLATLKNGNITNTYKGKLIVFTLTNDTSHLKYFGFIQENRYSKVQIMKAYDDAISTNYSSNFRDVNIVFYTNNNNNVNVFPSIDADGHLYITPKVNVGVDGQVNYQPYTINEGDTITNVINNYYVDSNTPDKTISYPSDNPNGSGGSGGSGGNSPNWGNPFPSLTPDGNGGFNFNFTLPDLNIDWNINGLSEKFPFSIPFDLIRFVSILNAEPETPHFEGTVNLIVYEWNIDADLSDFDNLAGIVRNVEFIGFCITLILITRRMIKG